MTGVQVGTAMDSVLEYLNISDLETLSDKLDSTDQLLEDMEIVTEWINEQLDTQVIR